MRVWFVVCLLALLSGCIPRDSLLARSKAREAAWNLGRAKIEWKPALSFSFDSPSDLERFRVVEGEWEIRDGALRAIGGDRNRAILIAPWDGGSVRIEFDATNHSSRGLIGDITVLIGATPDKNFFGAGYTITTGSYWNSCTTAYRRGTAIANTGFSPVESGRKNHVVVEYDRGHIRYEMNGEILLETWDPSPLVLTGDRWIGIRTWATRMVVDNVVISKHT